MLAPLTLRLFAAFACRGSWLLSASCPLVLALLVLLCVRFLPAMSFWLGRLLLMRLCLLVTACSLLAWCAVGCGLSNCRPRLVLLGVAPPSSAPLGVLRPKPSCGKGVVPESLFFSIGCTAASDLLEHTTSLDHWTSERSDVQWSREAGYVFQQDHRAHTRMRLWQDLALCCCVTSVAFIPFWAPESQSTIPSNFRAHTIHHHMYMLLMAISARPATINQTRSVQEALDACYDHDACESNVSCKAGQTQRCG
jgi:hypothetical protein